MYREEIMDHYKRPRNTGSLDTDHKSEGENASCGDKVKIYAEIREGEVEKIRHETEACAICTAATSIISNELEGENIESVLKLDKEWMLQRLELDISPMRVKCAVLGLNTLQEALS